MDQQLQTVIGDYQTFLEEIFKRTEAAGFDMADFAQCDHIGYRTTSLERYGQKLHEMGEVTTQIGAVTINDRPISMFRLKQPIVFGKWRIDALELLAPRPGNPKPEGLDHIELVLFDDMQAFIHKYSDKEFNTEAANRGINPELKYELGDHLTVKFHLLSLPAVAYIRNKLGLTEVK